VATPELTDAGHTRSRPPPTQCVRAIRSEPPKARAVIWNTTTASSLIHFGIETTDAARHHAPANPNGPVQRPPTHHDPNTKTWRLSPQPRWTWLSAPRTATPQPQHTTHPPHTKHNPPHHNNPTPPPPPPPPRVTSNHRAAHRGRPERPADPSHLQAEAYDGIALETYPLQAFPTHPFPT